MTVISDPEVVPAPATPTRSSLERRSHGDRIFKGLLTLGAVSIPVLLFTLVATTLAGILFGCAPAWSASRVDPNEALSPGQSAVSADGRFTLVYQSGDGNARSPFRLPR